MGKTGMQKSFAAGALVLMLSNLIVKIIGALLKIPLTNLIGLEGMAYYNSAYQIYALLFLISTSGLPVAMSRLVAKSSALGRAREVKKLFRVTLTVFFLVGLAGTLVMLIGANGFANMMNMPLAARAIIAVSPTIMLICIISAIRGYFQGLQNMIPTAISQMIEALLKLIIGYSAASYAMNKGYTLDIVAAFTISGVTIGVAVSTVFLIVCYLIKGRGACEMRDERSANDKRLAIRLIRIAVPISLTAAALYLANIVDLMTIVNVLAKKFGQESAELLYSAYSSISVTLANMPSTIIYAIATSILPSLVAALALKKRKKVRESMRASLRLTAVFAFPCAFGVCLLSEGIISCIYSASTIAGTVYVNSAGEAVTALSVSSTALGILAVGIIFITMYSTTNALMQSYGLEWYTIVSVLCGTGTKLVLSLILLNIKAVNIYGAALSTVACYVVAVAMNCRYLHKKSGHSLKLPALCVKPFAAATVCGISAISVYKLASAALGTLGSLRMRSALALIPAIVVAVCVYFVVLLAINGIPENELLMLPKGEKICSVLKKMKLLGTKSTEGGTKK